MLIAPARRTALVGWECGIFKKNPPNSELITPNFLKENLWNERR
jgi:hypothetical protein